MKTYFLRMLILVLLLAVISCKKDDPENDNGKDPSPVTLTGNVQKGPFITGTTITLNELNADLGQTGSSFTATILTNAGDFEIPNIVLGSTHALFTANGFYFNELYGELSAAPLTLQALTELSGSSRININVMTHLIKERIMKLSSDGIPFQQAKAQAQTELLAFFGITLPAGSADFEKADIAQNSELNATLLAVSVVVQRYTTFLMEIPTLTAELTQLLSAMSFDFKEDGVIGNQQIKDTLLHNISRANLTKIRQNLEKRYADLGLTVTIPDFEKYVDIIQKHLSEIIYTDFIYPEQASPYIQFQGDTTAWTMNFLNLNTFVYGSNRDYCVAAIVPFDSVLTVKFKILSGSYAVTPPGHGWQVIHKNSSGITLRSTLQNTIITLPLGFNSWSRASAIIEIYQNDTITPDRVKNITVR